MYELGAVCYIDELHLPDRGLPAYFSPVPSSVVDQRHRYHVSRCPSPLAMCHRKAFIRNANLIRNTPLAVQRAWAAGR